MGWIKTITRQRSLPQDHCLRLLLCCLLLTQLGGCSSVLQQAHQAGFSDQLTTGQPYLHRILINPAGQQATVGSHWHVYIEGDGQAVDRFGHPSRDPTPRHPMLLSMMQRDPVPALYLGRPCYFATHDSACTPLNWTLARYSEATISSMATALGAHITPRDRITLIGHSGGGTLAQLLAARLPNTEAVVTLAGNLQVAQWTDYHHYSPLDLSLDPAAAPLLNPCIQQYHLAAAEDQEILPQWIEAFAKRQPGSHFRIMPGVSHSQNWPDWWTLVKIDPIINLGKCERVTNQIPPLRVYSYTYMDSFEVNNARF